MWRDAFFLARKDAHFMLTRRETIVWTFVMPLVFFYFIGTITRHATGGDQRDPIAVQVPADAGFLARQVMDRIQAEGYRVIQVDSPAEFAEYRTRVTFPAHFTDEVLAGHPQKVHLTHTGKDTGGDYDEVRLTRAVYTVLADLVTAAADGGTPTRERLVAIEKEPHTLVLDQKAAGNVVDPPSGFDQAIPGTMVMFTLLVLFTSGAVTLTLERHAGILRRLAYSPMRRGAVVMGKWGARMIVGLIQMAFAMLAGSLLFGVRWGGNLPAVFLLLFVYGALAATLGMLLGNFGRTEGQVIGFGVIASNLLAGLGGCWWPIEITPVWAQKLALFVPTGVAMDGLHKLVNFGAAPAVVIPHILALAAAAVFGMWIMARGFKFQ